MHVLEHPFLQDIFNLANVIQQKYLDTKNNVDD